MLQTVTAVQNNVEHATTVVEQYMVPTHRNYATSFSYMTVTDR